MKTTTTIKTLAPILAISLVLAATTCPAQYSRMTPDQIWRQAQERQAAIQKIGEDFRRNALEVVEAYQQRQEQERLDRQREREEAAAERRAARDNQDNQANPDNQ